MKASTPELMKFQRLMRRLKESKRGTIGLLEGMWLAVGKNCPRGDIGKFSNEEIAIMCDWEGDADELVNALVDCGWLDVCSVERLVVHDWHDHCPTYVKGGLTTRGQEIAIAIPYSPRLEPQAIAIGSEPVSTYPNQVLPSQTKPILSSCSELSQAAEPVDASLVFECVGKNGGTWNPSLKMIDQFREWYPTVDVDGELRKAAAWHASNPKQRKTKSGIQAFLNSWLTRATNRAGPASSINQKPQPSFIEQLEQRKRAAQ
jgi:hypothetical protein